MEKTGARTPKFKSSYGEYNTAAVASDSKVCSDIGRDIMSIHGGNAVDAAIAVALSSSAIHPQSTGLGGGFFAVLYHRKHGWVAVDARETTPRDVTPEMFSRPQDKGKVVAGGMSVCVPGFLMGLVAMHKRFGSLPWRTLVLPTIKLLEDGFPLSSQTHRFLLDTMATNLVEMEGLEMFWDTRQQVKQVGSLVKWPKLALTFQTIADDPMSFYGGDLAKDAVNDIQEKGGVIRLDDLTQYQHRFKTPTQTELPGDLTLYTVPPPASGPVLTFIMNILSGYQMTPESVASKEAEILTYHRFVEACKFAYAKKPCLGDEDYVDVESVVDNMTSRSYGEAIRLLITDSVTHDLEYYGPLFDRVDDHGTSHSSILDPEGNADAITSSINHYFGSKIVGFRTGILFNNQLDDFSHQYRRHYYGYPQSPGNTIQPGKRPMSGMCPAIVWDRLQERVCLVVGAAGGSTIPAILAMEIKTGLKKKGHHFMSSLGLSVVQVIQVLNDAIIAGSDFRKDGEPSGF